MDAPWIEWAGGECPVPPGTLVDVKFRNETYDMFPTPAGAWEWDVDPDGLHGFDIVAYRVVTE